MTGTVLKLDHPLLTISLLIKTTLMAHYAAGVVKKLYTHLAGCYIKIEHTTSPQPKNNYFLLKLSHPNYNSLYTLVMAAATQRYTLHIRTVDEIDPLVHAEISYMYINW